ncbi:MAG: TVP38/TMEM64 family protein [Cellulosilyticaceae bacterium]
MSLKKATTKEEKIISNKKIGLISIGAIVFLLLTIGVCYELKNTTITQWLELMPKNEFAAAGVILLLYTIKSILFFIPVQIMYIISGIIFSPLHAILINIIGLIIELTLTFYVGKFAGQELAHKIAEKSPRVKKAMQMSDKSNIMVMVVRMIPIFPIEPLSVVFGAVEYSYVPYMIASLLGLMPGMIPFALMGNAAQNPLSKEFIIPFIVSLIFASVAIIGYNRYQKKHLKK